MRLPLRHSDDTQLERQLEAVDADGGTALNLANEVHVSPDRRGRVHPTIRVLEAACLRAESLSQPSRPLQVNARWDLSSKASNRASKWIEETAAQAKDRWHHAVKKTVATLKNIQGADRPHRRRSIAGIALAALASLPTFTSAKGSEDGGHRRGRKTKTAQRGVDLGVSQINYSA
jgi:hypothetical protein